MFVAKLGFSDVSLGLLLWFIVTRPELCHIKIDLDNDYLSNQSHVSDERSASNQGPY